MTPGFTGRVGLWAGRVARHVAVGDRDPQRHVRVSLEGLGQPLDVTHNHVIAGVQPLTIALVLPPEIPSEEVKRRRIWLTFAPREESDTVLGEVGLRHEGTITVGRVAVELFQRRHHTNRCLPWPAAAVFGLHNRWSDWKRQHERALRLAPPDLAAFQVLYVCPRPVVLVTVERGVAGNLFPMDLIGPTASPYFLMALRNTSPSIGLITESRRMALADVPLAYTAAAYKLGEHHRKERIDWGALPFETEPSPAHRLPVLRDALRLREVVVREARPVGSHVLFITETVHDERRHEGLQLFHLSGSYYRYLVRRGIEPPLPA